MKQAGHHYSQDEVAPLILLATRHQLPEHLTLITNWGIAYDGLSPEPTYSYVLSLSQSFGENWGTVYEVYGSESEEVNANYLGFGVGYLISPDFQLDFYVSGGDNKDVEELYSTLGTSIRNQVF